ncbi:diguanylate cyclase [Vibrio sp. JPW-9-11-11]|uniref:diguanylate cyclase n=1 Tax=Vibrio sp. JPW-9-11-11 TaxID=1416532 RepID=UPI001592E578
MNSTFSAHLAHNPDLMHSVFEALPEPTFLIDKSGTYVEAWGGQDKKRHHDPAALIGLNQYQVLPPDKAIWFSQVIVDVLDSQRPSELEYSLDPKALPCFKGMDGPREVQHFSALVIPLPETSLVLWTVRNITEYKKALETMAEQQLELEKRTYVDHLTQVYNRYALDSLLPDAIELAKVKLTGCAVLMIDVDCFKEYNDFYGHLKGDEVLKAISHAIVRWSSSRELCFRYGGDEFLVFMPKVSQSECLARAHQLQQEIKALAIAHRASCVEDYLTATIGIQHCALVPEHMDAEQLIAIADKALFYAKSRQRGSIHQLSEK